MKNLDLNNCGVQEMNAEEMNNGNGGAITPVAVAEAICIWLICEVVFEGPSKCISDFKKGYNSSF